MGNYNVICDISGFKCKASETRMQWNGLRVHKKFWEARHPQDYIPAVHDDTSVRHARPDSDPFPPNILLDSTGIPVLDSNNEWIYV